jgi:hypothetical protein
MEKWKRWCDERIANEVLGMNLHRHAWRELGRIVDEHGDLPPSYFWEYLRDTYAVTQSVAVRRQADADPRVISLGRLIHEIAEDAPRNTRELYLEMWELKRTGDIRDRLGAVHANQSFDTLAGEGAEYFEPDVARADLGRLTAAASSVSAYVDQHLAHSDAKQMSAPGLPTFDHVNDAIDTIGDLFRTYASLLTARGYVTVTPVIQDDWLAVFRQPWINPEA